MLKEEKHKIKAEIQRIKRSLEIDKPDYFEALEITHKHFKIAFRYPKEDPLKLSLSLLGIKIANLITPLES
jgi:hypothetical protein